MPKIGHSLKKRKGHVFFYKNYFFIRKAVNKRTIKSTPNQSHNEAVPLNLNTLFNKTTKNREYNTTFINFTIFIIISLWFF